MPSLHIFTEQVKSQGLRSGEEEKRRREEEEGKGADGDMWGGIFATNLHEFARIFGVGFCLTNRFGAG